MLFNAWIKRHEFLYVKEHTSEQHRQEFIERKKEKTMVRGLTSSSGEATTQKGRGKKQTANDAPNPGSSKRTRKHVESATNKFDLKALDKL